MGHKRDWYEYEKKSTNYFFNLEKHNEVKTRLRTSIPEDVNETNNPANYIKSFNVNVYKREIFNTESKCFNYLSSINIPNLSNEEQQFYEGKLSEKDVTMY